MSSRNQYKDVQIYYRYLYKDAKDTDFLLVTKEIDGHVIYHKRDDSKGNMGVVRVVHISFDRVIHEAVNGKWVLKK